MTHSTKLGVRRLARLVNLRSNPGMITACFLRMPLMSALATSWGCIKPAFSDMARVSSGLVLFSISNAGVSVSGGQSTDTMFEQQFGRGQSDSAGPADNISKLVLACVHLYILKYKSNDHIRHFPGGIGR